MVLLSCCSPCLDHEGVSSWNKLPDTVFKAELRFCVCFSFHLMWQRLENDHAGSTAAAGRFRVWYLGDHWVFWWNPWKTRGEDANPICVYLSNIISNKSTCGNIGGLWWWVGALGPTHITGTNVSSDNRLNRHRPPSSVNSSYELVLCSQF